MRRRITLYIDGRLADIDDASFVVFNWRREDTDNPAVIRNSWSNSVTLPGTPDNDVIFSHAFRCDRRYNFTPDSFDPSARTPFAIYQETGEILVSGYCKLDSVARSGATHSYKVTLFGGVGSLLYSLAYDASGNKRTLASLDFLGGGASELDFPITAAKVQAAWDTLRIPYGTTRPVASTLSDKILKENGATQSVGSSYGYYIDVYDVIPGESYEVKGRRFNVADRAVVALYDKDGVFVAQFGTTGTYGWRTYAVVVPDNAVTMYVQGAGDTPGATSVKRAEGKWDIVNFAPCYNGRPDGDFQADKALVRPADLGWPDSVTQGGKTYETQAGAALATLPDKMDEWQTKDLRAYLQRPVLSLIEFLKAIAKPENNGGWTLDISQVDAIVPWQSRKTWITLPMLPKEGTYRQQAVLSATRTGSGWHITTTTDEYTITGVQTGDNVRLRVSCRPVLRIPTAAAAGKAQLSPTLYGYGKTQSVVTFYQLIGYDGNGNKVAASKTLADYWYSGVDIDEMVAYVGYSPDALNTEYYQDHDAYIYNRRGVTDDYERAVPIAIDITGVEVERVEMAVKCYYVIYNQYHEGGNYPFNRLFSTNSNNQYAVTQMEFDDVSLNASAEGGALRSGMLVTKQMLLGGEHTPADYLIAILKAFNLYLDVNDKDRTAVIRTCYNYFDRSEVLDLSGRVDAGQEVNIVPLNYDAKWYDFKLSLAEGAFGLEYRTAYGVPYGVQRIDTGYDFDASAKDVLGGPALRSCVPVSKFSLNLCDAEVGGSYVPSPFIVSGGKYTLVASDGSTLEVNITPGAPVSYLNTRAPGYDIPLSGRPEFCKADGGGIDGQDCLVWLVGWEDYPNFRLTDDDALMPTIAGGLCWLLAEETLSPLHVPTFSPIEVNGSGGVDWMLSFGAPRELALPGVTLSGVPGIYGLQWGRLMGDRLDVDTKVVRVKVDLTGLQVGPGLLRKFVWWDGCLWSINAIENYSISTYDLADVELVQVHNINNYN